MKKLLLLAALALPACNKIPFVDCMAKGCASGKYCAPETHTCVPNPDPTPTPTTPTPTPTPTGDGPWNHWGCVDPLPPNLGNFGITRSDIRGTWEKYDVTPLTSEGEQEYCTSIGFVNRGSCPARMEGDDMRLKCERYMLNGARPVFVWIGDAADGGLWAGNPNGFTFEHKKGTPGLLQVCNGDMSFCQVILQ